MIDQLPQTGFGFAPSAVCCITLPYGTMSGDLIIDRERRGGGAEAAAS